MKTNITINIGLSLPPIQVHHAIAEIQRAGVTILASGIVSGEWEGKPEQTLVIQGLALESPELRPRLYCASRALNQDCIAIYSNGLGELIGDTAQVFNPDFFHFHAREEKEVNGFTLESFKSYLRDTIIPDSEGGYKEDLETALEFLESDSYIRTIKSNRE